MRPSLDIIIPAYQGLNLLKKHLPTVIKNSPSFSRFIVIDDGPADGTLDYLTEAHPQVIYLKTPKNLGFTLTVNRAVSLSTAEFVVLINDDVSPEPNYLTRALDHFSDPKLFALSFAEDKNSWPLVTWNKGKLHYTQAEDKTKPRYIAWPSGGSCLFRRSLWTKLGGFNSLYAPAYWEDIDLGYRAWKAGYRILWDPKITVLHQHESTYGTLDQNWLSRIKQRNELFFHWLNLTDKRLFRQHLIFLFSYSFFHPGYLKIILAALPFLPRIFLYRRRQRSLNKLNDASVLTLINQTVS